MNRRLLMAALVAAVAGSAAAQDAGAAAAEPAPAPAAAPAPPPAPVAAGPNPYARLLALPDLSAVGSFGGAWSDQEGEIALSFEELELGLRSVVDPWARAEIYLAFGEEEVAIEEAFVATTGLPGAFQLKGGRFFAPFGRANVQHPHARAFADATLSASRLVADEALAGPGLALSWLAPLPWFAELHLAVLSTSPHGDPERALTGVGRIAQAWSIGAETTVGLGLSGALRDEGAIGDVRMLGGVDLLVRWRRPASRAAVTVEAELLTRRFSWEAESEVGGYAQLTWDAGPRAGLGFRYDQAPDPAGGAHERRATLLGAWRPSEFQRLRLQATRVSGPGAADGFEALLVAEFGIGAHGAHAF